MIKISDIKDSKILVIGNHQDIIQSILDFDFLAGKTEPSVLGVVGVRQRYLRYFWGSKEILLPGSVSLERTEPKIKRQTRLFVVVQSGRRAVTVSEEALQKLPNAYGGMIFAEGVPERHSLHLRKIVDQKGKFVLGPASVGMVVGGVMKLGAIGGTLPEQIVQAGILERGSVAVISTSGGMVNEIINLVAKNGSRVSFAAAVGGERYPATKPVELVRQALDDKNTKAIVYFGEVGGSDEYEIADLIKKAKIKKPVIAYVAGVIAEKFENAPQFGHAKSLAQNKSETASAKHKVLKAAGITTASNFTQFEDKLSKLPKTSGAVASDVIEERLASLRTRKLSLFVNRVSSDQGGQVKILGTPLLNFIENRSLSNIALSMFLGKEVKSKTLTDFFDLCVRLLVDHGPQVSGAVNTMITTRAGKDLPAALAAGILTVGPRFGGAINQAAHGWFEAVTHLETADSFVEQHALSKQYISGIGHIKYRIDNPDPRVKLLLSKFDKGGPYTDFAKQVAAITSKKKAQLILNVDGVIAALLLDLLSNEEKYSQAEIRELINTDFCNAIFIYARTVGLISHHLEQQRLDENLFRLPNDLIGSFD